MSTLRTRVLRARQSFWFLPAVLGVLALLLAQSLIVFDRFVDDRGFGAWDVVLYRVGASGSRDILGAIGGSMLAVAATSFSITISVLATASSTYGPRLVRNFMSDRGNQFVLGIFGSTFLYSLMVLRSIRSEDDDGVSFVPDIAVNVAVLLAVVDVAVLVYFIHHIADSIQVSTLSARVRDELVDVVDMQYPEEVPENAVDARTLVVTSTLVPARASGFVVGIDERALVDAATKADCVIELHVRAGRHVVEGETVARVECHGSKGSGPKDDASGERTCPDVVADAIDDAVTLGSTRTPYQDIEFAVQQLTEMAVRAMSPSTNDPYTARNALAELAVGFVPLAQRPDQPLGRTDEQGDYRLTVSRPAVTELVDQVFDAMRQYGLGNPPALIAAVELGERIGIATVHPTVRATIMRQLTALQHAFGSSDADPVDVEKCRNRIDAAAAAIAAR